MSITSVNKQIKTAMKDSLITTKEAEKVVAEAEKGRLTVGEEKAIVSLFDKAPRAAPPGMMATMAIPEHPGDVQFEAGAKNVLETFFKRNDVPAGANAKKFLEAVKDVLAKGAPMDALDAPPDVKKLHRVSIPSPQGMMDAPVKAAFIDTKKNEFFLSVSSMFRPQGAPMTRWYGPLSLEAPSANAGGLSDARRGEIMEKLGTLKGSAWQAGGAMEGHLGVRFHKEELYREKHPDGYTYSVLVPVGALSPTAPKADPNKVKEVYFERSGGLLGATFSAGPISI